MFGTAILQRQTGTFLISTILLLTPISLNLDKSWNCKHQRKSLLNIWESNRTVGPTFISAQFRSADFSYFSKQLNRHFFMIQ